MSWKAKVAPDGTVEVQYNVAIYRQHISAKQVERIRQTIAREHFSNLVRQYQYPATDQDTLTLATESHSVTVYGVRHFCDVPDVQRFLAVWRAVLDATVVPKRRGVSLRYEDCR